MAHLMGHVFSHSFVTNLSLICQFLALCCAFVRTALHNSSHLSTTLQLLAAVLALAPPTRQSPVPTNSERPLNSTLDILSRGRKERHQRHQRHQPQQQHQQQRRQQQPPVQPDVTRERRVSESTSEPEPRRDPPSRSSRTTTAPKETIPHTYPSSRRKSRASTSQAGQSRSQIPTSGTPLSIV